MESYRITFLPVEGVNPIDLALTLGRTLDGSIHVDIDDEHQAIIKVIEGNVQVALCYEGETVKEKTFEADSIIGIYEFEGIVIEVVEE